MKHFIKRLFTRNVRYKVIALVLAVTIWYSVTERSFKDLTVSPVEIDFTNPENFRVHREALEPVFLKLNCPQYVINEYELSAKHFWLKAVIGKQSLSEEELVSQENYTKEVRIPLDSGMVYTRLPEKESRLIFVQAITPSVLRVPVSLVTKQVRVIPRLRGEPQPGLVAGKPELSSPWIELTGPPKALEKIDSIELQEIDLSGLTRGERSTQVEIPQEKLESLGVHAVRDSDRRIYVTIPIKPAVQTRTISAVPVVVRNAPTGAEVTTTYSPLSVEITIEGSPSVIGEVTADQLTAEVDLAGFGIGQHEVPLTIRGLPEGVKVTRRSANTVSVRIEGTLPPYLLEREIVR